jgi:hypothetical protein
MNYSIDQFTKHGKQLFGGISYNTIHRMGLDYTNNDKIFNEFDNLMRLRLLIEVQSSITGSRDLFSITMLGLSFYQACIFKP